mgnify:CR=1 FL=1
MTASSARWFSVTRLEAPWGGGGSALPASQASTSWNRRRRTSTSQPAGEAATLAASHRAVWLPGRPEGSGRVSKTALAEAAVSAALWSHSWAAVSTLPSRPPLAW